MGSGANDLGHFKNILEPFFFCQGFTTLLNQKILKNNSKQFKICDNVEIDKENKGNDLIGKA